MNSRESANLSTEILEKIKSAKGVPLPETITKSWTEPGSATTGINAYDLKPAARILYPVITPIRNLLPRIDGAVGTAANWRSITGINTTNLSPGLGDGQRGGIISTSVVSVSANYAGLGLDDYATFEADFAGRTFDDVKALAVEGLLRSLMIAEEKVILGGNMNVALGTTPTPSLADVGTGGILLANTTYHVICVALCSDGFLSAVPPVNGAGGSIQGQITRNNADGTQLIYGGGSAQQSADTSVTTANDSNNTHSITGSVALVNNAVAYAWYAGTSAAAARLIAITTINSVVITALNGTGQLATAIPNAGGDNSTNPYVFNGLLSQVCASGSNSAILSLPNGTAGVGTKLASSGRGTVTQIDQILQQFWNTYRLSPTHLFVNAQEMQTIQTIVGGNGGQPIYRMNLEGNMANYEAVAGFAVMSYINPFTYAGNQVLKIILHPNVAPGTMIFYTNRLPYPLTNVSNPVQMYLRRDYYSIAWPQTTRQYPYGVYMDGLLQNFFPPAFGIINNIAAGVAS